MSFQFKRVQSRRFPVYGGRHANAEAKMVTGLARCAARFLLPSVCLSCRRREVEELFRGGVCAACWESLPVPGADRCLRCEETLPGAPAGALCGRCLLDPPAFDRLRAAAPYQGPARQILLAFKFQGAD